MNDDDSASRAGLESGYAWLAEGSLPHSRQDRVAEALALAALLFSISIGVVIVMLPAPAQADGSSFGRWAWKTVPAGTQAPRLLAGTATASAGDGLNTGRCLEGRSPRPCIIGR